MRIPRTRLLCAIQQTCKAPPQHVGMHTLGTPVILRNMLYWCLKQAVLSPLWYAAFVILAKIHLELMFYFCELFCFHVFFEYRHSDCNFVPFFRF